MKGKGIITSILTLVIAMIGLYSGLFSDSVKEWLGVVSFTITAILATFPYFSTGTLLTGWTTVMWITAILGIIVQVLNYTGDHNLIPPSIINLIVGGINLIITVFLKNYGNGSRLQKAA